MVWCGLGWHFLWITCKISFHFLGWWDCLVGGRYYVYRYEREGPCTSPTQHVHSEQNCTKWHFPHPNSYHTKELISCNHSQEPVHSPILICSWLYYYEMWNEEPISVCLSLTYPSSMDSLIIRQLMMKSSTTMGYWRGSCLWLQHFPISSLLCVCSWSMLIRYQFQWQWHPKWLAVLQSCHEICFRCCFGLLWHTCDKNDICDKYFLHFLV